jgi:nucleotide-binding universal stress UspA family protein
VGTDGSEPASAAVSHAVELARQTGAEVVAIYGCRLVYADPGLAMAPIDPSVLTDAGREILREVEHEHGGEVKLRTVLREGDPAEAILDVAEEEGADVVVLGNRGMRGGKRFFLGSVPGRVAHHAPCSVLIVHTT